MSTITIQEFVLTLIQPVKIAFVLLLCDGPADRRAASALPVLSQLPVYRTHSLARPAVAAPVSVDIPAACATSPCTWDVQGPEPTPPLGSLRICRPV